MLLIPLSQLPLQLPQRHLQRPTRLHQLLFPLLSRSPLPIKNFSNGRKLAFESGDGELVLRGGGEVALEGFLQGAEGGELGLVRGDGGGLGGELSLKGGEGGLEGGNLITRMIDR